jgi:hypothetical protein
MTSFQVSRTPATQICHQNTKIDVVNLMHVIGFTLKLRSLETTEITQGNLAMCQH